MGGDFGLYESILWTPEQGYYLLDRHLERLERSARHFGFPLDRGAVEALLARFSTGETRARKVRLVLAADGQLSAQSEEVKPSTPVTLALGGEPVASANPFLRHKTTRRDVYERALAAHPEASDVLLWNERREITETCTGNIVLEIGGRRLTPARAAGLLPGTFRAQLLDAGEIEEAVLALDALDRAERLYLINSVRRWCDARLLR
jgi:branched-subunit amino acid aminotransferase/4-amino-4-deoxychorismate lyase